MKIATNIIKNAIKLLNGLKFKADIISPEKILNISVTQIKNRNKTPIKSDKNPNTTVLNIVFFQISK